MCRRLLLCAFRGGIGVRYSEIVRDVAKRFKIRPKRKTIPQIEREILCKIFESGDFFGNFDSRGAYNHVEIFESHRKFLGFRWEGKNYTFCLLPFGISSAGYIFTKLTRPLIEYWRSQNIRVLVYLYDGIFI